MLCSLCLDRPLLGSVILFVWQLLVHLICYDPVDRMKAIASLRLSESLERYGKWSAKDTFRLSVFANYRREPATIASCCPALSSDGLPPFASISTIARLITVVWNQPIIPELLESLRPLSIVPDNDSARLFSLNIDFSPSALHFNWGDCENVRALWEIEACTGVAFQSFYFTVAHGGRGRVFRGLSKSIQARGQSWRTDRAQRRALKSMSSIL